MRQRIVGRRVIHFDRVSSTMDEAAALAADGEPEGTVVVASGQTAGRGRAGRAWQAPPGAGLLCSVLLRPDVGAERLSVLPLLVGVAVAEAIEETTGIGCTLKWPNDVWINERKVAGILVNTRVGPGDALSVVAGIGINVSTSLAELPKGATSLVTEAGSEHDRMDVLAALLTCLDARYKAFVEADGMPDLADWRSRAALVGEPVSVVAGEQQFLGLMLGVDDYGALLLDCESGGVQRIVAGDLTRGPVRTANRPSLEGANADVHRP